jgi:hypothetical protein
MQNGVYYPTWSAPWKSAVKDMEILDIPRSVTHVYLAFANPECMYQKNAKSFSGTGLDFSMDFSIVVGAIKELQNRGTKVMLSVGGGSYWSSTRSYHARNCVDLCDDLGCDGIDIDWEGPATNDYELTAALLETRALTKKLLSFAGFSTGAYGKDGDTFKGNAIDAMVKAGWAIDWINIMAYDAGKDFDPLGAFDCFRMYYGGPLVVGFETGTQGWGDAFLTMNDVQKVKQYIAGKNSGTFVWCWKKDPMVLDILNQVAAPVVVMPKEDGMSCPNCGKGLKLVLK